MLVDTKQVHFASEEKHAQVRMRTHGVGKQPLPDVDAAPEAAWTCMRVCGAHSKNLAEPQVSATSHASVATSLATQGLDAHSTQQTHLYHLQGRHHQACQRRSGSRGSGLVGVGGGVRGHHHKAQYGATPTLPIHRPGFVGNTPTRSTIADLWLYFALRGKACS